MTGMCRYRILVTGSRGKSSLIRLLCAGIGAKGLSYRGRITGVLPRDLSREGERLIVRRAPGHVEEMRWWLRQIPGGTQAAVMENSAVHPEFQPLAAVWLKPTVIVLTNARPDHGEAWGDGGEAAARALMRGVPDDVPLVVCDEVLNSGVIKDKLRSRAGPSVVSRGDERDYRLSNLNLARKTLEFCGLLDEDADAAMMALPPDIGDFRVFHMPCGAELASAFSANDADSTSRLFSLLGWKEEETTLLFSGREDRPFRLIAFEAFFRRGWREVLIQKRTAGAAALEALIRGKQVLGCGNIAGAPLELLRKLTEENCRWTIPRA